jgi:hypothetical protein
LPPEIAALLPILADIDVAPAATASPDSLLSLDEIDFAAPKNSYTAFKASVVLAFQAGLAFPMLALSDRLGIWIGMLLPLSWLVTLVAMQVFALVRPMQSKALRVLLKVDELVVLLAAAASVFQVGALRVNSGMARRLMLHIDWLELVYRMPILRDQILKTLPQGYLAAVGLTIFAGLLLGYLATRLRQQGEGQWRGALLDLAFAACSSLLMVGGFHCLMVVFVDYSLSMALAVAGFAFAVIGIDRRIPVLRVYGPTLMVAAGVVFGLLWYQVL